MQTDEEPTCTHASQDVHSERFSDSAGPTVPSEPPAVPRGDPGQLPTQHPPVPLADICAARWQTIKWLTPEQRRKWSPIMDLTAQPSEGTLSRVYLAAKGLLATPKHGGRARAEAANRAFRARLALWKTGQLQELWRQSVALHRGEHQPNRKVPSSSLRKVAQLVSEGQLSRAARRLSSWGVAPISPATISRVDQLFPQAPRAVIPSYPDSPPAELTIEEVRKVLLRTPAGLAPGPSGLRADHLRHTKGLGMHVDDDMVLGTACWI